MHRLVSSVQSVKKRNLFRGYINKPILTSEDIETIRRGNSAHDSMVAGAILKGQNGLIDNPSYKKRRNRTSADIYSLVQFPAIEWRNEIAYTVGFVNSSKRSAIGALAILKKLSELGAVTAADALPHLLDLARTCGASNYLSYKLAYVRSVLDLSPEQMALVAQIETEIQHRQSPGLHFSALENLSSQVSIFVVAKRRVGGLTDRVEGNFRRSITLSNFIPTPLHQADVAGYLLRATESSLVDALYSIVTIFNLSPEFAGARQEFESRLDRDILSEIRAVISRASDTKDIELVTDFYRAQNEEGYASLDIYRLCAAFLERPDCALYRHALDKVIGARLLAEVLDERTDSARSVAPISKALLLSPDETPVPGESLKISLDPFYRTYLFLVFLRERANILGLSQSEVKRIFERTTGLDALLTENELRALYLTTPVGDRGLVTVLALALYRRKSVDPDVDFEFRSDFIAHVNAEHGGSIPRFISSLLADSPSVASYVANSLDEVTLEKMYTLVANASQASTIRMEILRSVGQKLNSIDYIVEADAILTRSKVAKLQQYFDSSRMYVDSIAMQKWLDTNPTIAAEQYRAINRRNQTKLAAAEGPTEQLAKLFLQQFEEEVYLVQQIAKDAFEQFCLNNEFGIQSYLGRRIRHNTLHGVMVETVDAVLNRPEHGATLSTATMRNSVQAWLGVYNAMIEKLRKEQLQFKSSQSLFSATLDFADPATAENVRQLAISLRSSAGGEHLNDLVISFCWKQVAPQLESASRYIKTSLLNEANNSIEHYVSRVFGSAAEKRLRFELHDAVNEVFKKVASWFQVPQTGFITASIRDLVHIILFDLNKSAADVEFAGDSVEAKFTGISVHRIYDCLAVLLQNACKHGEEGARIVVEATSKGGDVGSALSRVTIEISQKVSEQQYELSKTRIQSALASTESGSDMVTEGYSGIKKVKFITRASEGVQTVRWRADDRTRQVTMGFSLHAESAVEELKPA